MSNNSRVVRSTVLYIKLFKSIYIQSVQSAKLSIRNNAKVLLLLMYIFRTVRDLPVKNENACGNCKIFPRSYFSCLYKY